MTKEKIKVTAVSYINTLPFIYGLLNYRKLKDIIELKLLTPAKCAETWIQGETDIALLPVGAMQQSDMDHICCNYCLGATGKVKTVLLFSQRPIEELDTIFLDHESRTSVLLIKIIAQHFKHINLQYRNYNPGLPLRDNEGLMLIGDKTFGYVSDFTYQYDLAEEWHHHTGLPFIFAVWVAQKEVDKNIKKVIDEALGWGLTQIDKVVEHYNNDLLTKDELRRYLTENISFTLTDKKLEGMQLFSSLVKLYS
ncbi:MAG: menaquinone biosynthesis protein [Bacteroidales bacterium]|nr:menaquinone biosynthesis protein [Bacteroidales bacterium]